MAAAQPNYIGRYKVQDELGRGGFGRVYRAYDPTVGRPVAIKILTDVSTDTLTRFRNEATVAGNLRHKNIVTVYEYGTYEGFPFLAMEYLEGEDLHQIIAARRPLSLLDKCNIMAQVADGLYYAHASGVVHRDMKPANIMVLREGAVKIMDFGIARLTRTPDATRLTQQGFLIGTLRYMAPEQLAGADFDAQCDIFAYGVIFYELVTGMHPFEAPDAQSLMYRLTFDEPAPIRKFAPSSPESLQEAISKMVHKDRSGRYRNLKDLQFDTEPIRIDLQRRRASELLLQAQELFGRDQFEPAQKLLQEVLVLEPSNREARGLWESLQHEVQQRSLRPRIEASLSAGVEHLEKRQFGDALKAFESALLLDRDNAYIQGRVEQVRALVEQARRASQLLVEARREFEQQNLTAAYRMVSEALRYDPKNPEAADFLKTIQSYVDRRQAEQRVDDAIRRAQGLMLIPAYDDAIAVLTALDLESPRIRECLELVRSEKLAHERKQKLHREMAAATDLLREHRLDEAARCLESLQAEYPENQDVAHLLAYAQRERAAMARAAAIESAAAEAHSRAESKDFEGALATLDTALKKYPGASALVRLLGSTLAAKGVWERQQVVQSTLAKCESLRSRQQLAEAIHTVEAALEDYSAEPALLSVLKQLEAELAQQRRGDAVRKVSVQAERLLDQKQPQAALETLQKALARYPGDRTLGEILKRAQDGVRALEEARAAERVAAIEKQGREANARAANGDFEGALKLLDEGLRNWPDASSLHEIRKSALAGRERREERRRVLDELQEIKLVALQESRSSETAELLSRATGIASHFPHDEEIQSTAAEPIGILSDVGRARQHLADRNFQAVLETCERRLAQHPGHVVFDQYKREAERGLRRAGLEELHHRAAAEGDLRERARILELGAKQYPDETGIADQLRFTWNKLALIDSIVERARACESSEQWDEALEKWNSLLTVHNQYPGLNAEIDRVERARKRALLESIERKAQQIEQLLQEGDLGRAGELLHQAQTEHPDAARLRDVALRIQEIGEKRKRARELLAQAQAAGENGKHDEFQTCLRKAFQMDESDAAFRKLVLNRLIDHAQSAIRTDWRQAEALVGEATSLQPGYAAPVAVLQAIASHRQHGTQQPEKSEAVPVKASPIAPPAPDARREQKWPRFRRLIAANRRQTLLAAGVTAAFLAGAVIPVLLRKPAEVAVAISANVQGATVTIGGKTCVTPNCAIKLLPGTYTLQAVTDGYQAVTTQFTIRQAALKLDLTLKPLPELVQVNTNFDGGQVYLDGTLEGELRDGQYTASGITPGLHTIRVTGGRANFQVGWRSAVGRPPEVLQFTSGRELAATVVANAATTGSVSCNCDGKQVTVDGVPAPRASLPSGSLMLTGLREGARQIVVGGRSLIVDIRANPTLSVFLALDRNVGTLIVETGENGARIFVNDRLYRRTTERGMIRIPADAGRYAIRVEKDGFVSPAPQTVVLMKGEEKPLTFTLTHAMARLEIEAAVAGAHVRLDGQSIGETDRNGALQHDVTPGHHTIELSKEDYAPIRFSEEFRPGRVFRLDRGRVVMARTTKIPVPDIKQVEAQEWAQVANSTNPEDFDGFIRNHPGGVHLEQARARAGELRQQQRAAAAQQLEHATWERVDQNSREQLQDYLARFPVGGHAQEARARIAEAERQESEALASQRLREQREQEQARRATDERAILKVLEDFDTAYNRRDLPWLQRLWDKLPIAIYRNQFREAKDLQFQLRPTGQPSVNGASATVMCTWTLSYRGQSGGMQTHSERVKLTLSREVKGWLIRSIDVN
jgi:serine/threonine-protein kinase